MTSNWKRAFGAATLLAGIALLTPSAAAQCTPAATTNGPDVIVGDVALNAGGNYSSDGTYEALAIGTTSCNIGNVWLNWIASTNQHPVIGQTLYRYKVVNGTGRFEQLGQGWLKHGFFALSQGLCCSGCQSTDGSHLGVHCSDPYTASRNGSQSGAGPKWQVNANTGAFTYPPANPGWSGSIARRVQVPIADLENTGGTTRYFGAAQYVTPDDAAAGNQNNNESWREASVSGSGSAWTFGQMGSTQRAQYALKAWRAVDPTVTLTEVQVPGDGLLIVAHKVYSLGGGIHRYEYAVQNLNNDRSVGSFSVPANGVTISNIEFHDVRYHSGDGIGNVTYDGTDWAGSHNGSTVAWSTAQTFGQNPNGNALRWGTTYNFRFDANAPPVAGSVTLGYFKVGGQITAAVEVPGQGGPASFAYCFGDGTATPCPCGNSSLPGSQEGCLNSLGTGAGLIRAGTSSVSNDTLSLTGTGMPDSSVLYFQGTTATNGGLGTVFGDGLRCAGGTNIRLLQTTNVLGSSVVPGPGQPDLHVMGGASAGDIRTYQAWYRNSAAFCAPDGWNLSNGWSIVWIP